LRRRERESERAREWERERERENIVAAKVSLAHTRGCGTCVVDVTITMILLALGHK